MKWRRAAFATESICYLTPEELNQVMEEILAIYRRFEGRDAKEDRPEGALPVNLYAQGHPLPPTPSGN